MYREVSKLMATAAIAAMLMATPASAQRIVYDPTNYAQNLLSATRALEQIRNQIRQIDQATAMLRQNPLQLSPELTQSISEARELFNTAQGIAFEVGPASARTFAHALSRDLGKTLIWKACWQQSERWEGAEPREPVERAREAEARAAQARLSGLTAIVSTARLQSSSERGRTNRRHSGQQSIAGRPGASQLAEIQCAARSRKAARCETERMERLARQERAREIQRRAFPTDTSTAAPQPARTAFED